MTDSTPAKKSPRRNAKSASRQADLPLDTPQQPTPEPAPATPAPPATPPALADRAARYNRHRSPLDDRPLTEQAVQTPMTPRPVAPARPYSYGRPVEAREEAPKPDARPRDLDMAAIALRNRQARDAARDERPVAPPKPLPPPRGRVDRPEPVTRPAQRDDSMLARAARHNALLRDAEERPVKKPDVKPAAPTAKPLTDDQSMVARAADATRRRRDAVGGPVVVETPVDAVTPPLHLPTTAFVLVSRNDGGRVAERFAAWRALVDAADVRWWLLDLGSVDESIARAEEVHAQVVAIPGGAVEPLRTLATVLRRVDADTVVVADVDAKPDRAALRVLTDVRAGQRVAVAPADPPGVLAIDRRTWQVEGFADAPDLTAWSKQPLPGKPPLLVAQGAFVPRLLHVPRLAILKARLAPVLGRVRRLRR